MTRASTSVLLARRGCRCDPAKSAAFDVGVLAVEANRRSARACRSVFENEDMVTALKPIEVRTAAAAAVPTVAAALADAFIDDPVYTWMLPGTLRLKPRLRTLFAAEIEQYVLPNGGTVWTTSDYDGAVCELPPGAWEMPKSMTGKEALKWMRAFGTRLLARGKSAARDGGATPT